MTDYRHKSWWLESLEEDLSPNPALRGRQKADAAIIGGVYTGLSTAYHLKLIQPDMKEKGVLTRSGILRRKPRAGLIGFSH